MIKFCRFSNRSPGAGSILIALLVLLSGSGMTMDLGSEEAPMSLPKTFGGWTRPDEHRRILPKTIFEYMDGAGELYIGYRFKHLDVYEYTASGEDQILVELYWMESSDDAFGLLSGDWGGESVDLHQAVVGSKSTGWLPDRRALYGSGLLRIWSDNLYARVMAFRETDGSKEAVLKIGRAIAGGRKNPPPPKLLAALRRTADPQFRLRTDRICYFRSHLVLNSVYFLSTKNILNLDRSAEAVTATYAPLAAHKGRRPIQLILARYAGAEAAQKAIDQFEKTFLPEKRRSAQKSASGGRRFWQIEEGWLAYSRNGRNVAMVFDCPSRESATLFLSDALNQFSSLEATHD